MRRDQRREDCHQQSRVIEGRIRFRVGDIERVAGPGETLLAPKGIAQSYLVESDGARCLTITRGCDFETMPFLNPPTYGKRSRASAATRRLSRGLGGRVSVARWASFERTQRWLIFASGRCIRPQYFSFQINGYYLCRPKGPVSV